MTRVAVILAGGAGTRLWPLSSDAKPKQFLRLFDGESLLQKTWKRVVKLLPPESIYISTNERYRDLCLADLADLRADNIVTEPARRNTAPAIALTSFELESRLGGDTVIAFLPSDHFVGDETEFVRVLDRAFAFAERNDSLVTIAIAPTEPHTGYGYLELGDAIEPGVIALRRIVEKPSRERAEEFVRAGNYAWNGGMFIWRAKVFRAELERAAPDVARVTREHYGDAPSISIDYALMEKAQRVATVRGDFDWSDVGSWAAVARLAGSSVFTHSESGRRIVVVGVDNVAVVESSDGILVLDLDRAQDLTVILSAAKDL